MSIKTSKRIALTLASAMSLSFITFVQIPAAQAVGNISAYVAPSGDDDAAFNDMTAVGARPVYRSGDEDVVIVVERGFGVLNATGIAIKADAVGTTSGAGTITRGLVIDAEADADVQITTEADLVFSDDSGGNSGAKYTGFLLEAAAIDGTGTYTFTVWADVDADGVQDAAEASTTVSFTIGGAIDTCTVTLNKSTVVENTANALTVSAVLKDEDGIQTAEDTIGGADDIQIDTNANFTDEGDLTYNTVTGNYEDTLTTDNIAATATATITIENDATAVCTKTVIVAVLGVGDSVAVVASANIDEVDESVDFGATGAITVSTALSTVYFTVTGAAANTYIQVDVDAQTALGVSSVTAAAIKVGASSAVTYGVTNTTPEDGEVYEVTWTDSAGDDVVYTVTYEDPAPSLTVSPSAALSVVVGSTLTWSLTAEDQFGADVEGTLTASVAGRNAQVKTLTLANGLSSFSLTDTSTQTVTDAGTDTITFTVTEADADTATATVSITYTATAPAVATVTVTSSDDAPEVDTTEADDLAAAGSYTVLTAVLTNSSGNRLGAGVVVTFTQADSWFGANTSVPSMRLGSGSAITNAQGEAQINAYSRKTGTRQFTAAVGSVSGLSEAVTWANQDTDARYVSLTSDQSSTAPEGYFRLVATVTDRWDNPIGSGVAVTFSEAGVGRFATGAVTNPTTSSNGTASIDLTSTKNESGANAVTVRADDANQTTNLAGFVGAEAITGVKAGVRSASVTVNFTAPATPEVAVPTVAPTLTGSLDGRVLLFGSCMDGEGDMIIYVKSPGKAWNEKAKTLECAAGEFDGSIKAPKKAKYYRVKQEGTGLWSSSALIRP